MGTLITISGVRYFLVGDRLKSVQAGDIVMLQTEMDISLRGSSCPEFEFRIVFRERKCS